MGARLIAGAPGLAGNPVKKKGPDECPAENPV